MSCIAGAIERRADAFASALARDIGKPIVEARAEVARAVELTRLAVGDFCAPDAWQNCGDTVRVRPVATITAFHDDVDDALALLDAVPQGLIATLYSNDPRFRSRFLETAQAGVLKFSCTPSGVHAEAPFGGWKASEFGPPEHGPWDAGFYTRAQAIYEPPPS